MITKQENPTRKGQELELEIESLAYGGLGLAKLDDFVVFVKGGLPGQTVLGHIYKKKRGYSEAYIVDVLKESPKKIKEKCDHFFICSKLQNLAYDEQIKQKINQVNDAFVRLGDINNAKIGNIIKAKKKYYYRNKMEFSFSSNRWVLESEPEGVDKSFALGLHIPRRFDKILDIDKCHIQPKIGNKILEAVKKKCKENTNLKPYNPRTHIGFLRHLMIRYGFNTNQIMVNIVTAYEDIEKLEPIVKILKNDIPEVTTIINNINTKKADVSYGEYEILLHGKRTIEEKMNGLTFDISANSFFQTNTLQGEKLYDEVKKLCNLKGNEVIYDLYCGTGTIGLSLSQTAKHVYGFEIIRSSLENAQINATKNNVKNITFLKANLDTYFKSGQLPRELPKPNIIIVDPPRAGMHKDMVSFIPRMKPDSLIYVSCNPTTQARDSKILVKSGYHLKNISVVDMFPHTPHIETVALFNKE